MWFCAGCSSSRKFHSDQKYPFLLSGYGQLASNSSIFNSVWLQCRHKGVLENWLSVSSGSLWHFIDNYRWESDYSSTMILMVSHFRNINHSMTNLTYNGDIGYHQYYRKMKYYYSLPISYFTRVFIFLSDSTFCTGNHALRTTESVPFRR